MDEATVIQAALALGVAAGTQDVAIGDNATVTHHHYGPDGPPARG